MNRTFARLTEDDQNVADLHFIVYRIFFPVFIITGTISNTVGAIALTRPSQARIFVNRYFLALAVSNGVHCIMSIIVSVTSVGCDPPNSFAAYIYAHFGWTMISTVEIFSICVITWLSYDRLLALWFPHHFKRTQTIVFFRGRMIASFIFSFVPNILYIVIGESCCLGDEGCVLEEGFSYSNKTCRTRDGYDLANIRWQIVYSQVREALVHWFPICLILVFNIGTVVGVMRNRKGQKHLGMKDKVQRQARDIRLIRLLFAIIISFLTCNLPISIHLTWHGSEIGNRCHGNFRFEVFRAIGNLLQLMEQTFCFILFCLFNKALLEEIKYLHMNCLSPQMAREESEYSYSRPNQSLEGKTESQTDV